MDQSMGSKTVNLLAQVAAFLHLSLKRCFYGVIGVLMVLPVAFLAFLAVNATMTSMSMIDVMAAKPLTAVLTIIAGLDLVVGYWMWMVREDVMNNRTTFRWVIGGVLVAQLVVSNFVIAALAALALAFSGELPFSEKTNHWPAITAAVVQILAFGGCAALVVFLTR